MNNSQERVANDINGYKGDIASKLEKAKETVGQVGQQAYDSAKSAFNDVKAEGKEIADQVSAQATNVADSVRGYVKDYPIRSLAMAVGAGWLISCLRKRA